MVVVCHKSLDRLLGPFTNIIMLPFAMIQLKTLTMQVLVLSKIQ